MFGAVEVISCSAWQVEVVLQVGGRLLLGWGGLLLGCGIVYGGTHDIALTTNRCGSLNQKLLQKLTLIVMDYQSLDGKKDRPKE